MTSQGVKVKVDHLPHINMIQSTNSSGSLHLEQGHQTFSARGSRCKRCLQFSCCCVTRTIQCIGSSISQEGLFWRNQDAPLQVELYLLCSVATILIIRAGLYATGYPQLGGGGIHIAHMLWGGLLMFVSQMLMMTFVGRRIRRLASILGGIGFGTFIDELGKFLTSDNDYFFRPTPTILYVMFCLFFLILKMVEPLFDAEKFSQNEALANILDLFSVYASTGFTKETKLLVLELLNSCNPEHPLIPHLREYVNDPAALDRRTGNTEHRYLSFRKTLAHGYKKLVRSRYTVYLLNAFFITTCVVQMLDLALYTIKSDYFLTGNAQSIGQVESSGLETKNHNKGVHWFFTSPFYQTLREIVRGDTLPVENKEGTTLQAIHFALILITAICVGRGVYHLSSNVNFGFFQRLRLPFRCLRDASQNRRLQAFIWFRRAMIVRLLVTDALIMYHSLSRAFFEVAFSVAVIGALTFMIVQETTTERQHRLSITISDFQE